MTGRLGIYILLFFLLWCCGVTAIAQVERIPPPPRGFRRQPGYNQVPYRPNGYYRPPNNPAYQQLPAARRVQIIKENFISKQLMLSPEQTYKFLALYRSYQQEMSNVRRLKRLNNSDAQANGPEQINKELAYEHQLNDIKDHYTAEFLKIMPAEKVSVIFKSEREFNDEALRILQERRQSVQPPPSN